MKKYTVAVVGAIGAVGQEMISILEKRNFPVGTLRPLDVPVNKGKEVTFNKPYPTICGYQMKIFLKRYSLKATKILYL